MGAALTARGLCMDEPIIRFQGVNKWFGRFHVLRDVDLAVGKGERIVVCGPSGSGKSTLIKCVNGLEPFRKGSIRFPGRLTFHIAVGKVCFIKIQRVLSIKAAQHIDFSIALGYSAVGTRRRHARARCPAVCSKAAP